MLIRCKLYTALKDKAAEMVKKPNYLTVPAAIRELEKIEMARNISKESLEQKIEKTISKNREQYDRLTAELEELHKKQKAIQSEELLKAIEGSSKNYEEILNFIHGKTEGSGE